MTATRSAPQEALLEKIRRHLEYLDIEYGFTTRLARENAWTPDFARQVVDEYAKFLFIAREGGHPVSPPHTIDQAWHLHLVHTESYWGDFCPNVLQMQLHHSPATGTHGEAARFADWSGQTCASYRKFFGPPPSFWLDSPLPRTDSSPAVNAPLIGSAIGIVLAIAGLCSGALNVAAIGIAWVFGSLIFFAILQARAKTGLQPGHGRNGGTCGGSSCSTAAAGSDTASTPGAHASHSGHSCNSGHGGGGHSCGGGGGHGCGGGSSCGGGGH